MSSQQDIGEEDWRRLSQLWALLDPAELTRAMRRAMAKVAKRVQAAAAAKLSRLPIKNADKVAKSLWTQVRISQTKGASLRASAGHKRKTGKGAYLNERGRLKPAAMWLEAGTADRMTKGKRYSLAGWRSRNGGHSTGKMAGYGFMLSTQKEQEPSVTQELREEFEAEILRRSRKMGFI